MDPFDFDIDPDIRKASTLPGRFYADPRVFEAQRQRVFVPSWQFIGNELGTTTPGAQRPLTLLAGMLDEPLLLARDQASTLHLVSNVCTHRGNLLVQEPCTKQTIACAYHGRRFELDGRMRSMPEFETTADFPREEDHLRALPLERLGPLLFTSLAPTTPFATWIGSLRARMSWLPFAQFTLDAARSKTYVFDANWALYCDNYLEGFHIPYLHPTLSRAIDYGSYVSELFAHSSVQIALAQEGQTSFDLPRTSPDHGKQVAAYYWWLFPNLMFNFYPWGLSINVVHPLTHERTSVSFHTYVWKPELLDTGAGQGLDQVELEDEAAVTAVQRGVRSRSYVRGRYSPTREQGVHHFHRMLAQCVARREL